MIILETEEPVLFVTETYDGDIRIDYINIDEPPFFMEMTPIEASKLAIALEAICAKTDYFKGFNKDEK